MARRGKLISALLMAAATFMGSTATAHAMSPPSVQDSGVYYEIFVRSWYDTDGDGIGDLNGVTAKLDYLQSLGISGIWLMPINPSPSYHGYDITDYEAINPQYGSMADFEKLVAEAHKRGIRVIIDMVINHTSSEHPWFKAAQDPSSSYHDWYTWAGPQADLKAKSAAGSIAWHRSAANGAYYFGGFTGAMPDLNYDNPAVRAEMIEVGKFWLAKGVDGFRLDAARHIYDDFRSDSNKPQTVQKNAAWWTEYRQGLAAVKPDVYLVGEATRPTEEQLAPYLKPLGSVFNFPLAEQLVASAKKEDAGKLAHWIDATAKVDRDADASYVADAPFLTNHDQVRVLSQLHGNLQHMRMAAAMLLTLPGHPYIYYGEELGVTGRKPDPELREPMRWQRDASAKGTTTWTPDTQGQGENVSVEAEQADPQSLLNFYRTLIEWRREIPALVDGAASSYPTTNRHVAGWQRGEGVASVLVLHNLSGKPQRVRLDQAGNANRLPLRWSGDQAPKSDAGAITLPPYASVILGKQG